MMQRRNSSKKRDAPHCRENYEDHSLKFLDWAHHLGFERTWLGRILLIIEEKFQIKRISFTFFFALLLAYAITFEIRTPTNYQVGDIAKSDIISPVSFEMIDEITTEEKRHKAEAAVPIIFDYDPAVFEKVSGSVYRAFRLMRSEMRGIRWPKKMADREEKIKEFLSHKSEFEKELGVGVSDYLFEWLVGHRFSARYENIAIRNLEKWYENKIAENSDKVFPSGKTIALGRVVQKNARGREFMLQKKEVLDTQQIENFELAQTKVLDSLSPQDRANILAFSRLLIYPNLTLNKQEMENRRQAARDSVLPITISIKKNQTIVTDGTVIQPFHVAMLKEIEILKSGHRQDVMTVAMGLFFLSVIVVFFQYLHRFAGVRMKVDRRDILMMGAVILGMVVITKLFWFFTETAFVSKFGAWIPRSIFLYAAPVAAGPMLVGLVVSSGEVVWIFTAFTSIVMGLMTEMNFAYMLVTFAGGIAAARGVYSCKKRNDIYLAGVRTGLVNVIMIALVISISKVDQEGYFAEILSAIPSGFLGGIFSAFFAMMLVPLVESVFNYTTDVKLLELSNLNHPLLKDMIVKAPGTYHHSMMVGSMVEAASEEIGANPLLAKVMAYYHDIGKMEHANYFIENQKSGSNPHDHISPFMSKTLLIAHVKDGVELGIKHKLGKPIIDGVIQHHGTTLISYFYNKALDQKSEGDIEISEEEFRYPGPKPQFREAALCMLADSIEAAARSLDEPTAVRLQNIVRNIIQRKFMDGQLDECNLTLKDLSKVEAAFCKILLGIYHQRIDYPRSAGGGASEVPSESLFPTKQGVKT